MKKSLIISDFELELLSNFRDEIFICISKDKQKSCRYLSKLEKEELCNLLNKKSSNNLK